MDLQLHWTSELVTSLEKIKCNESPGLSAQAWDLWTAWEATRVGEKPPASLQ